MNALKNRIENLRTAIGNSFDGNYQVQTKEIQGVEIHFEFFIGKEGDSKTKLLVFPTEIYDNDVCVYAECEGDEIPKKHDALIKKCKASIIKASYTKQLNKLYF